MQTEEDFDLLLDEGKKSKDLSLDAAQKSIHNQLNQFHNTSLDNHFSDKILQKIVYKRRMAWALGIQIAAFLMISLSLSFLLIHKVPANKNIVIDSLNDNLQIGQKISKKKYYGLFISSTLCKPCIEFLSEINQFNTNHLNNKNDFEIIFIETTPKNFQKPNKNKITTIDFNKLKNKEILKSLREGHGPAFVVLDDSGQIVTKHIKNKGRQTFQTVLSNFNKLINKEI